MCYFKIKALEFNMGLIQNITMGSNWIDLKCSSQYVLTSLPPITKQSPTEGLVQANQGVAQSQKSYTTYIHTYTLKLGSQKYNKGTGKCGV